MYIKPENLQKTGSFKIRRAYNKIMNLIDEKKKKGAIASSVGNHAQGAAYGAKVILYGMVILLTYKPYTALYSNPSLTTIKILYK